MAADWGWGVMPFSSRRGQNSCGPSRRLCRLSSTAVSGVSQHQVLFQMFHSIPFHSILVFDYSSGINLIAGLTACSDWMQLPAAAAENRPNCAAVRRSSSNRAATDGGCRVIRWISSSDPGFSRRLPGEQDWHRDGLARRIRRTGHAATSTGSWSPRNCSRTARRLPRRSEADRPAAPPSLRAAPPARRADYLPPDRLRWVLLSLIGMSRARDPGSGSGVGTRGGDTDPGGWEVTGTRCGPLGAPFLTRAFFVLAAPPIDHYRHDH